MLVRQKILETALARGLAESTVHAYETSLARLDLLDTDVARVDKGAVLDRLWTIDSPNTRRTAVIALRAVLGMDLKIPKAVPRRQVLPDEDTLRLALMTSPFEVRGLLMMYAGLRVGEACAVTTRDVSGDRLSVDKQVVYSRKTRTHRLAPVKAGQGVIVVPTWLSDRVQSLGEKDFPDTVRHSFMRAGTRVGISLNPHLLRKWYATHLISHGVPLALVQKQMRHTEISTTLTYYQEWSGTEIHDLFD